MAIEVVRTPPAGPLEQPAGHPGRSPDRSGRPPHRPRGGTSRGGPDPLSIALFSLALLMILVALLAHQLTSSAPVKRAAVPFTLIRKIYRTRVIETIIGPGPAIGPSVTQSVASSGSMSAAPMVSTRTS